VKKIIALCIVALAGFALATVPNETRTRTYNCDGSATTYDYNFKILLATDLRVEVIDPYGVATTKTYGSDYSVSGVGLAGGGTVTLTAGSKCPAYHTIKISRYVPLTQGVSFRSQGAFSPGTHENAFDKLTMATQQIRGDLDAAQLGSIQLAGDLGGSVAAPTVVGVNNAYVTATDTSVPRKEKDRWADFVNIKDFGVDPSSNTTQVRAGLDAAIAVAAAKPNGGTVLIPGDIGRGEQTAALPAKVSLFDLRTSYKAPLTIQSNPPAGVAGAYGKSAGIKIVTGSGPDVMTNPNWPDWVNIYNYIDSLNGRTAIWNDNPIIGLNWGHDTDYAWNVEADMNNDASLCSGIKYPNRPNFKQKLGFGSVCGGIFNLTVGYRTSTIRSSGYGHEFGMILEGTRINGIQITSHSSGSYNGGVYETAFPYRGIDIGNFAPDNHAVHITSASRVAGIVTATTDYDFGTLPGQKISVSGLTDTGAWPPGTNTFAGEFVVSTSVGTTVTWADARSDQTAAGGSIVLIDYPAAIAARQLRNGEDTLLLQRRTETAPSGYYIKAIDSTASNLKFAVGIEGDVYGTSIDRLAAGGTLYVGRNNAAATEIGGASKPVQIYGQGFSPSTDAGATQTGRVFQGPNAPNNANGSSGDVYFRTGAPGIRGQRIFVKDGASWKEAGLPTRVALTYATPIAVDASLGDSYSMSATNGTAFTMSAPTNGTTGQRITILIRNTSGGALGAVTWDAAYKLGTWTQPANGFYRAITFEYNGSNWYELSRTPIDAPN
jgi:hypothetical protein